jgi:hypothetical protein
MCFRFSVFGVRLVIEVLWGRRQQASSWQIIDRWKAADQAMPEKVAGLLMAGGEIIARILADSMKTRKQQFLRQVFDAFGPGRHNCGHRFAAGGIRAGDCADQRPSDSANRGVRLHRRGLAGQPDRSSLAGHSAIVSFFGNGTL